MDRRDQAVPENRLRVDWQPRRWWSNYERGIVTEMRGLTHVVSIWRRDDGQIRIYTHNDIHGRRVIVNDEHYTMRAAGRFGLLHISE